MAVALTGHGIARAQDDPFARTPGLDAHTVAKLTGPGLSEIVVDGRAAKRMVDLSWSGKDLLIDADAARVAGLPVPDGASGKVLLSSLTIAKWEFDTLRQRLSVALFRKSDGANLIDLNAPARTDGVSNSITALRVNYDITASVGAGKSVVAGYIDPSLVRGNFYARATLQATSDNGRGHAEVKRLTTSAQLAVPEKGIALTAGDFVTAGGQTQRALRMGGLQIASDFSLRPDLVTIPLPSFSGQVAVPTGIDIITADRRVKLGDVEPGEFTVRNVPSPVGRGEVSVVLHDTLGREVVQSTRFYVTRSLLAPRLSQFGANIGFVRRQFGTKSFDYGQLAASAFYRRGLSPFLTVEGSGEWTRGTGNIGGRADFIVAALAQISIDTRASHDSRAGTGGKIDFSVESTGQGLSLRGGVSLPSASYRDVASKLGDTPPPKQLFGQFSFDLRTAVRVQVSAARQEVRYDRTDPRLKKRTDVLNLNLRTNLRKQLDLFTNASLRRTDGQTSFSVFAGITMQLGGGKSTYGSFSANNSNRTYQAGFRRFDIEPGDIGYTLDASKSDGIQRIAGSAAVRREFGRIEVQAEEVNGDFSGRLTARGTLILADGTLFARNQTSTSLALVRTTGKVDGVTILRENRPAGTTARGGLLLVEGLPANAPTSINVEASSLPIDALARATAKRILVPNGAVGLVELDVVRYRPVLRKVVDQAGNPLRAGMAVVAQPSGDISMIGFDGYVEINAAGQDAQLVVGSASERCVVDLAADKVSDEPEGPPLRCAGTIIARLDREANARPLN